MSRFRAHARRHPRWRDRDDAGMTLVEVGIAMTVFLVLLGITFPILNTYFSVDTSVTKTVSAVNQILPATTTLERYLRSAVQPAPATVVTAGVPGTPVPMFAPVAGSSPTTYQMGPNSFTFYSNVGDANGPEQVVATTTGPNSSGLYTLTITAQQADPNTCPGSGSSMSSTTGSTCAYTQNPAKIIAVIKSINNGAGTNASAIFQYSTTSNSSGVPTYALSSAASGWNCTSSTNCNPANLQAIEINLSTQATVQSLASIQTVVYFIAPTYSAAVG